MSDEYQGDRVVAWDPVNGPTIEPPPVWEDITLSVDSTTMPLRNEQIVTHVPVSRQAFSDAIDMGRLNGMIGRALNGEDVDWGTEAEPVKRSRWARIKERITDVWYVARYGMPPEAEDDW